MRITSTVFLHMPLERYQYLCTVQKSVFAVNFCPFDLLYIDENQDLEMCQSVERSHCHQEDGDCQPATRRSSDQHVGQGMEITTEPLSPSSNQWGICWSLKYHCCFFNGFFNFDFHAALICPCYLSMCTHLWRGLTDRATCYMYSGHMNVLVHLIIYY